MFEIRQYKILLYSIKCLPVSIFFAFNKSPSFSFYTVIYFLSGNSSTKDCHKKSYELFNNILKFKYQFRMKIEFTRAKMCYKMRAFFEQARYPNSFAACPTNQVTPHVNQLKLQHRRKSASSDIMRDVLNSLTLHMPLIWVGGDTGMYIHLPIRTYIVHSHTRTHTYISSIRKYFEHIIVSTPGPALA